MEFPRFGASGSNEADPVESLKSGGWFDGSRPPAKIFNWLHRRTYETLRSLSLHTASLLLSSRYLEIPDASYTGTFNDFAGVAGSTALIGVAVGSGGGIQSTVGGTWTAQTPAGGFSGVFAGVAYSSSLGAYVAVGSSGTIQSSADGVTWTSRTADGGYSGTFYGAIWVEDLGLFVVVGGGGEIQTSPDGVTWTSRAAGGGFSGDFRAVTWSGGLLCAVGVQTNGAIQTSPDGITWTQRTPAGAPPIFHGVAYGNGRFVVVGASGFIQTSTDGVTWTSVAQTSGNDLYHVEYAQGLGVFVAAGDSGQVRLISQENPSGLGDAAVIYPALDTIRCMRWLESSTSGVARGVFLGDNGTIQPCLPTMVL